MEDKKEILLTQEGYQKLEDELEILKTVRRREVADRIKVAISFGTSQKMLSMMKLKTSKLKLKKE